MFGLSLTKLLFTAVVIAGVWRLYRYLDARGRARPRPRDGKPSGGRDPSSLAVEDLIECTICGTYVPAQSSGPCDRPDCPHRA